MSKSQVEAHESEAETAQRQKALGVSGAALETHPRGERRRFNAAEKVRIVKKADACLVNGERGSIGAMLREEGIYSSQLATWRGQLGAQGSAGLEPQKVGRKPKLDAKDRYTAELVKRNAVLERKLHVAEVIIDLQKKAHEILGIALPLTGGDI